MKKLLTLTVLCIFLTSCNAQTEKDWHSDPINSMQETTQAEDRKILYPMDDIKYQYIEGYLHSTLNHVCAIGDYYSPEHLALYLTAPCLSFAENQTYLIRRFPEDTVEAGKNHILAYAEAGANRGQKKYVEIYNGYDFESEPELLYLNGIDEYRINYEALHMDMETEKFYLIGNEQLPDDSFAKHLYIFDQEGNLLERRHLQDIDNSFTLNPLAFSEDKMYYTVECLSGIMNGAAIVYYDLYCYDMTEESNGIIADEIIGFSMQEQGLYFMKVDPSAAGEKAILYRYDEAGRTSEVVAEIRSRQYPTYFVYDQERKRLLYEYNGLQAYDLTTHQQTCVVTMVDETALPMALLGDSILLLVGNHQYQIFELPDTPVSTDSTYQTLRICYISPQNDQLKKMHSGALRLMETSGYPLKAEDAYAAETKAEYVNTMAKKLMAGDTDFDIFYVSTEMADLFKSMYYEDLSQYGVLNRYYERMLPGMEDFCSIDGIPCLIPRFVSVTAMIRDDTIADAEDFSQMISGITPQPDQYVFGGVQAANIFMPWFEQYAANYILRNMDDVQAKEDLTMLYRTAVEMTEKSTVYIGKDYRDKSRMVQMLQNLGLESQLNVSGRIVSEVCPLTPEYRNVIEGNFYAINPYSPNKELAAVFLGALMEYDIMQGIGSAQIYEGIQSDIPYSESSLAFYDLFCRQIADGIRSYEVPDYQFHLQEQFDKIAENQQTVEEAVNVTFRYLKMIRDE